MNRYLLSLVALLAFGSASFAFAQTDGGKAFKSFTDLAVGGVWTCEIDGEVLEDKYERILDGQFVRLTSKGVKGIPNGTMILGVDPVTKQSTWWGFFADGGVSKGTSRQTSENTWVGEWSGKGPKGSTRAKERLTKVDADTIMYEVIEQQVEGEVKAFPTKTIWKRKR